MNWYERNFKYSAKTDTSVESYLTRIGVPEETVSFVTTILDPSVKQQVVGYLSKNPQTPAQLLINKLRPQQNVKQEQNTIQEINLANSFNNLEFQKWLLVNLRKSRNEYKITKSNGSGLTNDGYSLPSRGAVNFTLIQNFAQEIFDWYTRGVLPARNAFQNVQSEEERAEIINEYGITNINTNLASLTLDQAVEFSEEWHKVISGQGSGYEYYNEKKEDIVYGPRWKNEEFNGWTIKQIKTRNNLKAEGNKMGHCSGSYCDDVESGNTRIFSLRDPANNPYVTIEASPSSWHFMQIFGNGPKTGNADPNSRLKSMIGEWMKSLSGVSIEGQDEFNYYDLKYNYRDLDDELEKSIYKGVEEYGIPVSLVNWEYDDAYEAVYDMLKDRGRNYSNDGGYQTPRVAKILARAAIDSDSEKLNNPTYNEKYFQIEAYNLALRTPKHYVMKKEQFDKMTVENKKEYVKNYIPKVTPLIMKHVEEAKRYKWYGSEKYLDPKGVEKAILDEAYGQMSTEKLFDSRKITSFHKLDSANRKKYMSLAIDKELQTSRAYQTMLTNDESFFNDYDSSYLYENNMIPPEPEESEFESTEDYEKAYSEWESEKQRIEDEEVDEARKNNLPYNLDMYIMENIKDLLAKNPIKIPQWMKKFFAKSKDNTPNIFWLLESAKKERSKKANSGGWYNLFKFGTE